MKHTLHYWLLLFCSTIFAQQVPKVNIKNESDLKLTELHVDVKIVGNLAVTTYDMKFYNGLNRTLEGELVFPLGEGQSVSGFAMDVNGKIREATIVEKELGRVAYENTMRQVIDPGLLEKTEGNNYRARVYPILAKQHKRIIVTFEQSLHTLDGKQTYELPLGFTEKLNNFSAALNVYTEQVPLIAKSDYKNFHFRRNGNAYVATIIKTNHNPKESIVIQLSNTTTQENLHTYNGYFHFTKSFAPSSRLKNKPGKITLLWDASYSMQYREFTKELQLLENYLKYLQNVQVDLIVFSNQIQQRKGFTLRNGDTSQLFSVLKKIVYDGGTRMDIFKNQRFRSDEILLFSDGLANLGEFNSNKHIPIYTINSLGVSNHDYLQQLATETGGNYLNLSKVPVLKALQILKRETFQFLGIEKNSNVLEVYPKTRVNVWEDFSISGQFVEATQLQLLFGYGGKVTEKVLLDIEASEGTEEVKRLWAKEKLAYLNQDKETYKEEIISLSKQYHVLTDFTSMIVLDRIEDYVRYKIEPPAEMLENYKELLAEEAEAELERQENIARNKNEIQEDYKNIIDWYFKEKKVVHPKQDNTTRVAADDVSVVNVITGTIKDENGQPLPGASIQVKGTNSETTTDFDGKFSLNVDEGNILKISYVGYEMMQVPVNSSRIDVLMKMSENLESVTITGHSSKKESAKLSYSVTAAEEKSMAQVLRGSAAGVQVSTGTGQPGQNSKIIIRGRSALVFNGNPLYVIDGVPTNKNVQPDNIQSVTVLKQAAATAIYGSRGRNGVILITTKSGSTINKAKIDLLNKKIEEIKYKSWKADMPYIKLLEKEKNVADAYKKYIEIRDEYSNTPTFYLDVADFFNERKATAKAETIITNLVEIELGNYELLKAAAYKMESFNQLEVAVKLYEKVLELRPEEPQSYRDLALAYAQTGKIQESYELLYKIYDGQLLEKDEQENYLGMEAIAFTELAHLIQNQKKSLNINIETKRKLPNMPMDVRVVIDWNHADTDIDLWVVDPNGEKAYYSNPNTKIGGRMSNDLTEGYGPEDFMLKNAVEGMYTVYVNHYADDMQKISGPTILKVTMYTNYGKNNETKEIKVVRLEKKRGELEVGHLLYAK